MTEVVNRPEKAAISADTVLGLKRDELKPQVRTYADNLAGQVKQAVQGAGLKSYEEYTERVDSGEISLDEAKKMASLIDSLKVISETGEIPKSATIEKAKELFGTDFLGPDQIKKALGFEVDPNAIPNIKFSQEELERAKELDQYLILRMDRDGNGTPLTMEHLVNAMQPVFTADDKGKILYGVDWYPDEPFYKTETPRMKWALVSKSPVPDSTSANYLKQSEVIAAYLKNTVFRGQTIPPEYQAAFTELDNQKGVIASLIDPSSNTYANTWKDGADRLAKLKLTQLTRQLPVEVVYDFLVYFRNTDDVRLLESMYTWTAQQTQDGSLVLVGYSAANGASGGRWYPDDSHPHVGVVLSR